MVGHRLLFSYNYAVAVLGAMSPYLTLLLLYRIFALGFWDFKV